MPLPDADTQWPPAPFDKVWHKYKELAAWYSGDPQQLMAYYGSQAVGIEPGGTYERASQFYGGIVGALARAFWGTPKSRGSTYQNKLHIPIAEEIASEGSFQLFRKPPKIEVTSPKHQVRIEEYIEQGLFVKLLQAAEIGAALGDSYIRVGYNQELSSYPLLSVIHPDAAVPYFSYDILREVTFWRILIAEGGQVFRHLEHHKLGQIEHGLYHGTANTLGKRVSLTALSETRELQDFVPNQLSGLDCVFIPNLNTRIWRDFGQASNLGRSDFNSAISAMDALDEAWTSWMRDIWLGKARLIVPQGYLDSPGRGKEGVFDVDRAVFVEINAIGLGDDKLQITPNQFAIRFEAHSATTSALTERIVSGSGYSAQTFGLSPTVAMTATESDTRENKTENTRGAKIEIWKRAIVRLIGLMLQVDARWGNVPDLDIDTRISVEFPPAHEVPLTERSQTAKTLKEAEAASIFIRVRIVHPDWSDTRVDAEVTKIMAERGQLVA